MKHLGPVKLKPGKSGNAEIAVDTPSGLDILHGSLHGQPLEKRKYTRLLLNGEVMMTDAEFEIRSNSEFVFEAGGDILIAGLGIGLILGPILEKESVKKVIVVEKSFDVIKLVYPFYESPKLSIINKDILAYEPSIDEKFDVIYFDIWPNVCSDYYEEIKSLKLKFKKFLRKGGWMHAWCEDMMRRQ